MKNRVQLLYAFPILLCCFILLSCSTTKLTNNVQFEENPPFTIEEAFFQKWTMGKDKEKSGTDILIRFSNMEENVTIEEIHFQNQVSEINNTAKFPLRYSARLTNEPKDITMHSDPLQEVTNTVPQKPIIPLTENQAVLRYSHNGKIYYFKIDALAEKSAIAYPH